MAPARRTSKPTTPLVSRPSGYPSLPIGLAGSVFHASAFGSVGTPGRTLRSPGGRPEAALPLGRLRALLVLVPAVVGAGPTAAAPGPSG